MNKKFQKLLITVLILCIALVGCTKSNEKEEKPAETSEPAKAAEPAAEESRAFEGKYIVNADYVKNVAGKENVLLIDARGEDGVKEGTIEGAIAVKWQMLADVSGKAGDKMWGTVLQPAQLSEKLSSLGISKDKEIIIFGAAQNGWGDEGRILWELNMAGFENAKMVDGGFDALSKSGLAVVKGAKAPVPAEVTVTELSSSHNINTEALQADYKNFKVVEKAGLKYNLAWFFVCS